MAPLGKVHDQRLRSEAWRYPSYGGSSQVGRSTMTSPMPFSIVVFCAFIFGATLGADWTRTALTCTVIFTISTSAFFLRTSTDYSVLIYRGDATTERNVYGGALQLIRAIEAFAPPGAGSIAFWFAPKPGNHWLLSSVQSPYLDGLSRIGPNPPTVDQSLLAELGQRQNLVILGITPDEVAADITALRRAGVQLIQLTSSVYPR